MKKLAPLFLIVLLAGYFACPYLRSPSPAGRIANTETAGAVHDEYRSGEEISGSGIVEKVLPDDTEGDRHQRFILRLPDGRTLLVAHNIDLAERLPALAVGERVSFRGEYVANERGGVVHWTHHDPRGRHADGWLETAGRRYQ